MALPVAGAVQVVGHDATLVALADARPVLRTAIVVRRRRTGYRSNAPVCAVVVRIVPVRIRLDAATLNACPLVALRVTASFALVIEVSPGCGDDTKIFLATPVLD